MRYSDDGHIKIDTNAADRTLRAVALRRKNYLFVGSDSGGERAVAIYSLIGSAKLSGLAKLGPASLSARGPDPHRRPSHHSHRGAAALENRRRRAARNRTRNPDKKALVDLVSFYLLNNQSQRLRLPHRT